MKEFQQRVVDEKLELDGKITRLKPFLDGDTFQTLPKEEQYRLMRQLSLMAQYSEVLGERITAFTS